MPKAFIVTATGAQGSALCRLLLASPPNSEPWTINATTRNTSSAVAVELAKLGVNFTQATWDDTAALEASMQGCTHLFLNLMPNIAAMTSELPWAEIILEIASRVGVKHVVYAGAYVGKDKTHEEVFKGATRTTTPDDHNDDVKANPMQELFERVGAGKTAIEPLVLSSPTKNPTTIETATVLLPAFFMLNLLQPRVDFMYPALASTRVWTTALQADTQIPLVDPHDTAQFAAMVFADPVRFNGRKLPVWSELRTPGEMLKELNAAVKKIEGGEGAKGGEFQTHFYTPEEIAKRKSTDLFVNVQLMMRDMGVDAVKQHPVETFGLKMTSFGEFLDREMELVAQTYCKGTQ